MNFSIIFIKNFISAFLKTRPRKFFCRIPLNSLWKHIRKGLENGMGFKILKKRGERYYREVVSITLRRHDQGNVFSTTLNDQIEKIAVNVSLFNLTHFMSLTFFYTSIQPENIRKPLVS